MVGYAGESRARVVPATGSGEGEFLLREIGTFG